MGHAGAIVSGGKVQWPIVLRRGGCPCTNHSSTHPPSRPFWSFQGDAGSKIAALEAAGVVVTNSPAQLGSTMLRVMQEAGLA